jgi:hypothetical protein
MRRWVFLVIFLIVAVCIFFTIRRSLPYGDRPDLLSDEISIDSIRTLGTAAWIYDKTSKKYYWLKSYKLLDQSKLDTLKSRRAVVRYVKFFKGPLENRIFYMRVDSVVLIDQIIERE